MSRNVTPVAGHGPSSPGIDRILLRELQPSAKPTPPAASADDAYWRAHPDEFMQGLLAATRDFAATR